VVIGIGVLAIALSSGSDKKPAREKASAVARVPATTVTLQTGVVTVETAAKPVTLDDNVRTQVMNTLALYVNDGVEMTLRTGMPDPTLANAFDDAAQTQLNGADRSLLVDQSYPKPTRAIAVTVQPVPLTGLADKNGTVVLVAAGLDLVAITKTAGGAVTVTRKGELLLAPSPDGTWRITAYSLQVARIGPGLLPPVTTKHTTAKKTS